MRLQRARIHLGGTDFAGLQSQMHLFRKNVGMQVLRGSVRDHGKQALLHKGSEYVMFDKTYKHRHWEVMPASASCMQQSSIRFASEDATTLSNGEHPAC